MNYRSVSVCLASYNGEKYIAQQLASIVNQLNEDDELLVADDGSSDGTLDIISLFPKCRLINSTRVGSVVSNFERLIAEASKDIIVLCDQDDVWLDGRIELIKRFSVDCDLVVTNGYIVDDQLIRNGKLVFDIVNKNNSPIRNLIKNTFIGCTMAFDRKIVDGLLPFPKKLPWHDWYIGLICTIFFRIKYIDSCTFLYRRHSSNLSSTGQKSSYSFCKKILMRLNIAKSLFIYLLRRFRLQ